MARFKSLADQEDSQEAICDYMYYREENKYMHRARVLISSCGKNQYNRILNIIPEISTNDAHVYIEGDAQFERDYYLEYSNKFQEFSFISGTLLIKARDRWGNSIEIDITNESWQKIYKKSKIGTGFLHIL